MSVVDTRTGAERDQFDEQRRALQAHAAVFVVTNVVVFTVNLFVNLAAGIADEWSAWWAIWALLGSGIGVSVHAFVVWLNRPAGVTDGARHHL